MGAERWRYAETLEEITALCEPYFLDSTAMQVTSFPLVRWEPLREGSTRRIHLRSRDISGPEVDAEARSDGRSLVDQSVTLALRSKQLVYHSAPFERDTEISGFFKLSAWISIDCSDTDLYIPFM